MTGLKGGVELNEVGVVQLVHHLDLIPDNLLRRKYKRNDSRFETATKVKLWRLFWAGLVYAAL